MARTGGNSEWNAVAHDKAPEPLTRDEGEALFNRVVSYMHRMNERGVKPAYLEVTHAQAVALLLYLRYPVRTYPTYLADIKAGRFQWGRLLVAFGPLLKLYAPARKR